MNTPLNLRILALAILLSACSGTGRHGRATTQASPEPPARTPLAPVPVESARPASSLQATTPPDYLSVCRDEMHNITPENTTSSAESIDATKTTADQPRERIFMNLSTARCLGESQDVVVTRVAKDSGRVSLVAGTVTDCRVAECVRVAVEEAVGKVESQPAEDHFLRVQVDENGRLGSPELAVTVPAQSGYCKRRQASFLVNGRSATRGHTFVVANFRRIGG